MDIFANGLRRDLPRLFPGGKVVYPGIGIFTREVDGKVFVSGRMEGLPGEAGLLVGDEMCRRMASPSPPSSRSAARWESRSSSRSGAAAKPRRWWCR